MPAPRLRILAPLAIRDFAFLWVGMSLSLLGNGVHLVAVAWQVYELSDTPTALSIVGVAWTLPQVVFFLVGGVVSDRVDRRRAMVASDLVRMGAMGAMAALALTGTIELWHVVALVAVHGVGSAFFYPAFGAIVPDIVPKRLLVEANSLDQFVRPFAQQLVGPALGGLVVATAGVGWAFALDAATFGVSAIAVALMTPIPPRVREAAASPLTEIREGFAFVRSQTWLWGTLLAAAVSMLVFWGPYEVLIPYLVKHGLGGGADDLGLIFAAGGAGSVLAALVLAQRGLPERHMLTLYGAWALSALAVAGYGIVGAMWQALLIGLVVGIGETVAMVIWGTLMHRLVPGALLGRVTSIDWMVSTGLVPVSLALTGPVAAVAGVRPTLIGAGVLGAAATLAVLLIPGVRDTEWTGLDVAAERVTADLEPAEPVVEPVATGRP